MFYPPVLSSKATILHRKIKRVMRNVFVIICGLAILISGCVADQSSKEQLPNVILVMADDLGYGDIACYGNDVVATPALDQLATEGVKFQQFYAAAPVCSPTRGSCLTGRHPFRYGIPWAGDGFLPEGEVTIAEALKIKNYRTGHFGKWHVGELSKTVNQSYFAGDVDPNHYSPPWENGFDECFSTESMMPTYNPYYHVGGDYGTEGYLHIQNKEIKRGQRNDGFQWRDLYWTGPGQFVDEWLEGDDSKIIMDRALNFIGDCHSNEDHFLSVIWFHTPHTPVVAGNEDRKTYSALSMEEQHWYGAISAMDKQVGRLMTYLKEKGLDENTIVWFCSDNGPSYIHNLNSSGGLRGKKATLYEGGLRVPAMLYWPRKLEKAVVSDLPVSTSDIYPTVLDACGIEVEHQPILDGKSILSQLQNKTTRRSDYLFFQSPLPARLKKSETTNEEQYAVIDGEFKLISVDNGATYQLYNIKTDKAEQKDISYLYLDRVGKMRKALEDWRVSCKNSAAGNDYQ
ncbi:N-acetylgalactosamine 6-sulfate sulfatase [Puteibacter caeruleilacunae]|nr:N-acetylgalactosamine 6-sulfate sulfatase [Puteibacter caeruleilacunae]